MAGVNGIDHLVRHEKESKLNGYDNEGFHSHERGEDEEESASDDDRLRAVVTENGRRPEDGTPLSNGHVESNGHSTAVNGSAVIVVEDCTEDSQKHLDTRLHHFVPADDMDRKVLNGSDTTRVTIPEDAVINFTTGRVKVKRGASNNQPGTNDRESIPLETMLPAYQADDKLGLGGEKAGLEAELANHKNGLWSEGHNAYSSAEAPFGNSEKLNGTSKSSDEISLPANSHRKCLSSDESDTNSEQNPTGEKLYFTEENRKLCNGWRRIFVCGLILIILAVALLLGVLAATGILLAESESKNTRYESGHSLPSVDPLLSHAGHSLRPHPSSKAVPHKVLPPVTGDDNSTAADGVEDTVSQPPRQAVTSKVPLLNDSSHSQTIVPNALVGKFTIDEIFTEDLKDSSSEGYQTLAKYIERELHGIFRRNGGMFEDIKILSFSPGSIKIKFVTIWTSDRNIILSEKAVDVMKTYLKKNRYSLLAYPVDMNSIHFTDVFDECRAQKGGCSFDCIWDYNALTKTCICEDNMILMADGISCGPKPLTSHLETTTQKFIYSSTSTTEVPLLVKETPGTIAEQPDRHILTTTEIPDIITKATELSTELTTESIPSTNKTNSEIPSTSIISEFPTTITDTTTEAATEVSTDLRKPVYRTNAFEIVNTTTTEMPVVTETSKVFDTTESFNTVSNMSLDSTTSTSGFETSTVKSAYDSSFLNESNHGLISVVKEEHTHVTTIAPPTTEPYTLEEKYITTIGYHIVEETTEVYTLKDNTNEFDVTTPNPNNTTGKSSFTSPTTTLQTTTAPAHTSVVVEAVEIPVTESSKDGSVTESSKDEPVTESSKDGSVTETPDIHPTDTILNTENAQYYTTIKPGQAFTDIMGLKVDSNATSSTTALDENGAEVISNETKEFEISTVSPGATVISIPPTVSHWNKTPEVRSFENDYDDDDDMMNGTYTLSDHTHGVIPEATTEMVMFDDKSSTPGLNADDSSLFTTELPTVYSLLPVTTSSSGDSASLNKTADAIPGNSNDTESITSTGMAMEETTTAFTDFSEMDAETGVNTEPIPEFTTRSPHSFGTTDVTIPISESKIPTVQPTTEAGSQNETGVSAANGETALNESPSKENATGINMTPEPFETSENYTITSTHFIPNIDENTVSPYNETTVDLYNETEVNLHNDNIGTLHNGTTVTIHNETTVTIHTETTGSLHNETALNLHEETAIKLHEETTDNLHNETPLHAYNETTTEPFETAIPNIEYGTDTSTDTVNYHVTEVPESSPELANTEDILTPTTSESTYVSDNQTIFDGAMVTVAPEEAGFNASTTNNEETTKNEANSSNATEFYNPGETYTMATDQNFNLPSPPTAGNESAQDTTIEPLYDGETISTAGYKNETLNPDGMGYDSNFTNTMPYESTFDGIYSTLLPGTNESTENGTFTDDFGNFTTDGYEDVTNETTTNATTGIECREDQFFCESLNKCINDTFMCDGIEDCPDGQDEFECKNTCHSNFMCANSSSTCIMSDARCDGIWDCENGTDEDNCTPTECAKHEVMCSDGSKCIKPGDICDWKYNCLDRSDEVGCVERTTCESGGRFFCNDGLCIPWSLKCDGEHDCKEGEDEANCTCLSDEFQCNDGKCLKSSSRCDGHQDCHDADDEMGCVNVDSQHMVSTFEPYSGTWGMLCAEDWNLDDGQYLCQELGFGHALSVDRIHLSFNGTWMSMRRHNLTEASLWTERVSFVESCNSGLAALVQCQEFACGEYSGLLHRRRRDVISSTSSQWPFIGYTSTVHSNRGCLSEILTPIWLITSAECLLSIRKGPFNGSDWYVTTNIGRNVESDVAQNHDVLRIITHPHSSKFRSLTLRDYDVAMVRLKHALVFVKDKIGAICPPDEQVPPGITCFSGVLGSEKPRAPPPQVLTINSLALQIIDRRNCNRVDHYNNLINQRMLCTQSSEGHTICDNDEGTPLMCLTGINQWFLAGMLTYQRYCDVYSKHPAVFSNLFSMRKFLDQVTGQKQYNIPYDSSVYAIIPPTTPSPTLPESTTVMTITDSDADSTTAELENYTEGMYGAMEDINSTTVDYEELAREGNDTAVLYNPEVEIASSSTASEDGMLFDNETTALPNGTDMNTATEVSKDGFSTNRTHSYLTSVLNETSNPGDEFHVSAIVATEDGATSSYFPGTATVPMDLTNPDLKPNTTNDELLTADATTTMSAGLEETVTTGGPIMDAVTADYTTVNPILNGGINNSNFPISNFSEATTTEMPSTSTAFDEISEILKPMIPLTNENSQPLISAMNDTTEKEAGSSTTSGAIESNAETTTTGSTLFGNSSNTYEVTTAIPTTETLPAGTETEIVTTASPILDATDAFTFEVEGEHNADLAFSVFKKSDSLRFEPYNLPDKKETINTSSAENATTLAIGEDVYTTSPETQEDAYTTLPPESREDAYTSSPKTREDAYTTKLANREDAYTTSPETLENAFATSPEIREDVYTTSPETVENAFATSPETREDAYTTELANQEDAYTTKLANQEDEHTTELATREDAYTTTYSPSVHETSNSPPITTSVPSSIPQLNVSPSEHVTGAPAKELETTISDQSTYITPMVEITTETLNTSSSDTKHSESITSPPEVVTNVDGIGDPTVKEHLISEETTVLSDDSPSHYIADCGLWNDTSATLPNDTKDLFMKWPALGYLQMASKEKICPSAVVSNKFVMTSLNCLTASDKDWNPDKWTYFGGLYQSNIDTIGTQKHAVEKIIPLDYPDQSTSFLLFNEHDFALVGVKDTITIDDYSRSVCLPPDDKASPGKDCFVAGWNKNTSDVDLRKESNSIPLLAISNEECNNTENYNGMLLDHLICGSHNEGSKLCQMDFGSPLFCLNENKHWEIHGILNYPGSCDKPEPIVFSSTASVNKWITDTLTDNKSLN